MILRRKEYPPSLDKRLPGGMISIKRARRTFRVCGPFLPVIAPFSGWLGVELACERAS